MSSYDSTLDSTTAEVTVQVSLNDGRISATTGFTVVIKKDIISETTTCVTTSNDLVTLEDKEKFEIPLELTIVNSWRYPMSLDYEALYAHAETLFKVE